MSETESAYVPPVRGMDPASTAFRLVMGSDIDVLQGESEDVQDYVRGVLRSARRIGDTWVSPVVNLDLRAPVFYAAESGEIRRRDGKSITVAFEVSADTFDDAVRTLRDFFAGGIGQ